MSPNLRAAVASIAADNGGVVPLSPAVLCDMVEMAERTSYLDGATWVVEQLAHRRAIGDVFAELQSWIAEHAASLREAEELVKVARVKS